MKIKSFLTWRTMRFVGITVVLGAVGSGVWEWLLKPALAGVGDVVLNIATLGVASFKDSLYKQIALGFHEAPSLRLLSASIGFLTGAMLGLVFLYYWLRFVNKTSLPDASVQRAANWVIRACSICVLFMFVFGGVQITQLAYINRAIGHFNQLHSIAAPYLTEEQRLNFRSRFSQVASRDDYVGIVNGLSEVCRGKNLRIPEFSVW